MTSIRFFTVKEAGAAIAAQLDITDADDRIYAARCHEAALVDAIASNVIVYRDPVSRLPIRRDGIVATLVACNCVISDADLNAWLDSQGVGVRVAGLDAAPVPKAPTDEDAKAGNPALQEKPTSAELASALGPYLRNGRDSEWLKRRLNDADDYPRLKKYRAFEGEGKRPIARWDVGGVVLHLMELAELTRRSAKEALAKHYPQHSYVLDGIDQEVERPAATWFPTRP